MYRKIYSHANSIRVMMMTINTIPGSLILVGQKGQVGEEGNTGTCSRTKNICEEIRIISGRFMSNLL